MINKYLLVSVVFLLAYWQLTFVNAQPNSTSILVPSNMNRMEITLKNDESANPISIYENPLLIALISGLSAILGGVMGSYMTNRSNRKLESDKYEREQKKQEQIKANVRALVLHNLKLSQSILFVIKQEDIESKTDALIAKTTLQTFQKEYAEMPMEKKSTLFKPDVLTALETFYNFFVIFSAASDLAFRRFDEAIKTGTNEQDAIHKLNAELSEMAVDELFKFVENAIKLLSTNI